MFVVGDCDIEAPVPINAPPQLAVDHLQKEAPVPRTPSYSVNVVEMPEQKASGFAPAELGAVDKVLTDTATEAQLVVLQSPSALT